MVLEKQNIALNEIITAIFGVLVFSFGVYLQVKKIQICLKEDDVAKKLEITNSVLMTIIFSYDLLLYGITTLVKELYKYTGEWFCYLSKELLSISDAFCMGHSFVIALLKYLVIVHAGADPIKKDKFKKGLKYSLK